MTEDNLLNRCRDNVQLSQTQIDSIVFALCNRCNQAKKDKMREVLSDVRNISKTGHLAGIKFFGYGVEISYDVKMLRALLIGD